MTHALTQLRHFVREDKAVAAIEFALIAPLMVTTYFGAYETGNILLADRKVTNVAAATTDLVAQALQISDDNITDIFNAASAIMEPYNVGDLTIIVSSIEADVDGDTTVGWSDAFQTSPHTPGMAYDLPDNLVTPGASVIVTEVTFSYETPIGQFLTNGITVEDNFYQRPRRVLQIMRIS